MNFGTGIGLDGNYVGGDRVVTSLLELADGRLADLGEGNLGLSMGFDGGEGDVLAARTVGTPMDTRQRVERRTR